MTPELSITEFERDFTMLLSTVIGWFRPHLWTRTTLLEMGGDILVGSFRVGDVWCAVGLNIKHH